MSKEILLPSSEEIALIEKMSGSGHWFYEPEANALHCSEQVCRIAGVRPGSAPENLEQFLALFDEEDRGKVRYAVENALESGELCNVLAKIVTNAEKPVQVRVAMQPSADLASSRSRLVGVIINLSEVAAAFERGQSVATLDPLTGSFTLTRFFQLVSAELKRVRRSGRTSSLVLIDIDRFSSINEKYGVEAGNKVLKSIAISAQKTLRDTDAVGRLGGNEFGLLLPETTPEQAELAIQRLAKAITIHTGRKGEAKKKFGISVSSGIISLDPEKQVKELFKEAHEKLTEAKKNRKPAMNLEAD